MEVSASCPGRFVPAGRNLPGTHWIGDRVGLRAAMNDTGNRRITSRYRESNLGLVATPTDLSGRVEQAR